MAQLAEYLWRSVPGEKKSSCGGKDALVDQLLQSPAGVRGYKKQLGSGGGGMVLFCPAG
jgi:hypothetical protein